MSKKKKLRGNVLGALREHDGKARLSQIAQTTGLTTKSAKDMLKHLEKNGHVVCTDRHSHDSRWGLPPKKDQHQWSKKH